MPLKYWDEAFLAATYLINRTPTKLSFDTPINTLLGAHPDYSSLRVFGCACWPNLRPYNSHKLQFRSTRCIFLGYSNMHKEFNPVVFFPFASLHSAAGPRYHSDVLLQSPSEFGNNAFTNTINSPTVSVMPPVSPPLQLQLQASAPGTTSTTAHPASAPANLSVPDALVPGPASASGLDPVSCAVHMLDDSALAPGHDTPHVHAPASALGHDEATSGQDVLPPGPSASTVGGPGILPHQTSAPIELDVTAPGPTPTLVPATSPVRACPSAPLTTTASAVPPASSLVRPTTSGVAPPSPARTRLRAGISRPKIFTDGTVRYGMITTGTPYNLKEALSNTDWRAAMDTEYQALLRNQTWHLVPPEPGRNLRL
jgi:hypothetical protein